MKTVSRKRFERGALVSGIMYGFGILFGFLLAMAPQLQMRGFDGWVRPLIVGALLFFLACALPYLMVRGSKGMEPKIGESSRKQGIVTWIVVSVLGGAILVSLSRIYHEVWGAGAVVFLIGLFVVVNILIHGLSRWARNTE